MHTHKIKTYFFTNNINRFIKIGKSIAPHSRANQIMGQWPFVKISVLHVLDGDYENLFHRIFYEKRVSGEWYDLPDITILWIENVLKTQKQKELTKKSVPLQ